MAVWFPENSQCSLFRLSLRCLIPLVLAVAFIQLAIYLWSVRWHAKGAALTPMVRKDVQASKEALGTCSYQLCPKVAEGKLNIHLIPHSHIDVGWTHTVDEYYTGVAVGTGCVQCTLQRTVEELAKNPDRRFIFIEMKYLSRFWSEINDTERSLIRQLINERRLELVGGGWVMSDSGVTMYNDIIDQHTLGFDFITNTFGHCAHARGAWHVDLFGYSREHASILSQMGYDSLILNRIDFQEHEHRKKSKTQEFLWLTSPQNLKNRSTLFTSLLTDGYWAPDGYVMDKEIVAPEVTKNVADLFVNLIKEWAKNYQSKHIVVPVGSDFAFINAKVWYKFYDALIEKANKLHKDVHLLYSTPSCYAHSVNQERLTLDTKIDDFLPYSIPPAAFWTGFYTTRGGFKKHIKQAGQILQSCKQLSIFTDLNDSYDEVNVLRDALGVMQHHDAITGTQRHHVLLDYNRILSNATSMCQQVMAKAYRKLWNRSETGSNEMAPQFCFGLNISSCQVSEEESQFLVTVYNPLSWSFDFEVRFPVSYQSMAVTDASGEQVFYQVVPIHDHIVRIPERIPSTAVSEAVLLTRLPPMSVTTFIVQQGKGVQSKTDFQELPETKKLLVENEHLSLEFDLETGLLSSITNKDRSITQSLKQEFRYYKSEQNSASPSGVYLFTPESEVTISVAEDKVPVKYIQGPLVQEVHQTFSPWTSQVIRLYKRAKHVEFQWTVGPIDDQDQQGREVISIFTSNLVNKKTFYTDSNGREMMQRIQGYRSSFNFEPKSNVSQNYYPVTSRIYIKDEQRNVQLTVLTDRPQGGSSLTSGAVELMVHRRVFRDDDLGLAEELDDRGADGKGVIFSGKHYLILDTIEHSVPLVKHLALQVHLAPTVMFTPVTKDMEIKQTLKQETFLSTHLPSNIHVLTLDRISSYETHLYLLRIEHLMEEDEHKQLSSPARLSLQSLFNPFEIVSVVEKTLGGNFVPADLTRLTWKGQSVMTPDHIRSPDYQTNMEPPFTVTLRPMEIRTFNILVKRTYY